MVSQHGASIENPVTGTRRITSAIHVFRRSTLYLPCRVCPDLANSTALEAIPIYPFGRVRTIKENVAS